MQRNGKVVDSHHFSCASRAEWIDVMVTLSMPEVTDTQSALIQAQKPTKAMLLPRKSKEGPTQHTTVNPITPQGTARKAKLENCKEVHFKVGKRLGMMDKIKTKSCMGRAKRESYLIFSIKTSVYQHYYASYMTIQCNM